MERYRFTQEEGFKNFLTTHSGPPSKGTWDLTHEEKLNRLTTEFYDFHCISARGYPRLELIPPQRYHEDLVELSQGASSTCKPKMKFVGRAKFDFAPCSLVTFISTRMKELFQQENFTGWASFEIERVDANPTIFHGLIVRGRATKDLGSYSSQHGVTVGFDKISWDGTDFFHIGETRHVMATKRVIDTLLAVKARGFSITPIDPAGTLLDSQRKSLTFK